MNGYVLDDIIDLNKPFIHTSSGAGGSSALRLDNRQDTIYIINNVGIVAFPSQTIPIHTFCRIDYQDLSNPDLTAYNLGFGYFKYYRGLPGGYTSNVKYPIPRSHTKPNIAFNTQGSFANDAKFAAIAEIEVWRRK